MGAFRLGIGGFAAALAALAVAPVPAASAATNPWMTPADQFVNFAHQGGELEAPGNTMYAFKTAIRERGADGIEMDAYISADGQLVVIHDRTLQGTTNSQQAAAPAPFGPGQPDEVWDYTVAELKTLDDAHWFAPGTGQYDHGRPPGDYIFRGVADGEVTPPPGYTASDFRIPTFQEVLDEFPDTRIDIEIKSQSGHIDKGEEAARELAAILAAQPGGDDENVLVSSFGQAELEAFHEALPQHDSLSASLSSTSDYALGGVPIQPPPQALQPPDIYDLGGGLLIDAPAFLKPLASTDGYALHVWGSDAEPEGDHLYQHMLDVGVAGILRAEAGAALVVSLLEGHPPARRLLPLHPEPGPARDPSDPEARRSAIREGDGHGGPESRGRGAR